MNRRRSRINGPTSTGYQSHSDRGKIWLARGHAKAPERRVPEISLGSLSLSATTSAQCALARQNIAPVFTFPFYQRVPGLTGFTEEAERAEQGIAAEAVTDRLLDAICLIGFDDAMSGPASAFRAAGLDLLMLYAPVGVDARMPY
jgi:hypothetical protein